MIYTGVSTVRQELYYLKPYLLSFLAKKQQRISENNYMVILVCQEGICQILKLGKVHLKYVTDRQVCDRQTKKGKVIPAYQGACNSNTKYTTETTYLF